MKSRFYQKFKAYGEREIGMNEIEVKILEIDIPEIISQLEKHNLTRVKDEAQVNTIYDFPELSLLSKKGYATKSDRPNTKKMSYDRKDDLPDTKKWKN